MSREVLQIAATRVVLAKAQSIWGPCYLGDLGSWAGGSGFPLEAQGRSDLPIPFCKVSDMNSPGNERAIVATKHTIDESLRSRIRAAVHPAGTVIFPKIGGAIATNKRRILASPMAFDNNVLGIVPGAAVRSGWLYHVLRSIDLAKYQSGTSVPALKQSDLAKIEVPAAPPPIQRSIESFLDWLETKEPDAPWDHCPSLPEPLAEQRRIVAKIDQLAAKIAEARGLRERSGIATNSILPRQIAGIFDAGQADGWRHCCLGDYVTEDCYGTSEKTNEDSSGTPVLRMGNIQNGRLHLESLKYLHLDRRDRDKLLLRSGDILVNRTNSAELVGKCAVYALEGDFAFASYLIRLRLDTCKADPQLVALYINSPIGRAYMFNERKQMTGQANVNAKKLKALPLPLPPLPEQRRIVAYLDDLQAKVDRLKALQAQTAAELNALLPAILDKAFKGEL